MTETPTPEQPNYNDPETLKKLRQRQRSRSIVMAIGLFALCILFYFITVAKIAA